MSRSDRPAASNRRLVALDGAGTAAAPGRVWLVGAGPGDPELLTLKAARLIAAAQVIVHDGLVSREILEMASPGARLIDVAKRKSRHTLPQDDINQLLVAFALQGLDVVRLKGGDPFIFGRGGEELLACRAAGVACEVVPGVTAALAASAGAGAPLTHRGAAQAVTFVTGHAAHGEPDLDWPALAKANQTVVIYMGLTTAGLIAGRLMDAGRDGATPALVVVNASRADETRHPTTLAKLAEVAEGLSGPALLIVGEAMALALSHSDGSREGGNPSGLSVASDSAWVPAFAGMNGSSQ
ncbi:uroporphyrinogen-III C-methyltransferase [Caulobacter mirabilis]|uniref:uroporphyrinogen-III C-methyltransferase n=1 Tax=Caulobacter mirabilis TaxID=69666 RepID=A0A2D2AWI6_9CAUL|nr:uroporphyrinogen-III C-methyltransferase [Caulobacter mirabilis]